MCIRDSSFTDFGSISSWQVTLFFSINNNHFLHVLIMDDFLFVLLWKWCNLLASTNANKNILSQVFTEDDRPFDLNLYPLSAPLPFLLLLLLSADNLISWNSYVRLMIDSSFRANISLITPKLGPQEPLIRSSVHRGRTFVQTTDNSGFKMERSSSPSSKTDR